MKFSCTFSILLLTTTLATAQARDTIPATPLHGESEVEVQAFTGHAAWKAAPAAVAVIGTTEIGRYAGNSMVPVMNTVPGIRMEERSPASYRLSFRGSLLRSPFGVRNVKVYWNGIPLTDGGGNTYLNLVDLQAITSAELLKGPVASRYGAGTGGALLLRSAAPAAGRADSFNAALGGGSFGYFQEQVSWSHSSAGAYSTIVQSHLQSDGYRQQSASRKDAVTWHAGWDSKLHRLRAVIFYTDLYYQTPGGITFAQMQADPTQARQAAGALPGAVQQQAAVYNKTIFGGLHDEWKWNDHWSMSSFITANHTSFTNPFITNYEKRDELNLGAGSSLIFQRGPWQWSTGAELLFNHSRIDDYGNRGGKADTVQFKDNVYANQLFLFSQWQLTAGERWVFNAGVSFNNQSYRYERITDLNPAFTIRTISPLLTPRFAVLYKISNSISAYALVAQGFSPPALAELRPSDGNFYGDLNAESGWNAEIGLKGDFAQGRGQFDAALYSFSLRQAIVRRNNAAGAEFFVNAGGTSQNGAELMIKYQWLARPNRTLTSLRTWISFSYQPYTFGDYRQGTADYSGNRLTGVPRTILVAGVDLAVKRWYLSCSVNATSSLPLTDANDAIADPYQLVQAKLGYKLSSFEFYAAADNIMNQRYSLGNDINAAGKRYYNPAAPRNIFAGIRLSF
jgi:iron complex outermembrane receptor protein